MLPEPLISERRSAGRIPARTAVRYRDTIYRGSIGFWEKGELLDMSMSGARFWCEHPIKTGTEIEVRVEMEVDGVRQELELPAECVRVEEASIAVRFLELDERAREALGRHLARVARRAPERPTMKREPRMPLILSPGRTTHVL
jgi:hypothetical protein